MTTIDNRIAPEVAGRRYVSRDQAHQAALHYAASRSPGHTVIAHKAHAPDRLPHFHVVTPAGGHLRPQFSFGCETPTKTPRGGRPDRAVEDEGEYDTELDQFFNSVWGRFKSALTPPLTIIPRSGWGARPPKRTAIMPVPVRYAFIHHTAGGAPTTESEERADMRRMQAEHQQKPDTWDIAYNFIIMPSGRVYEGRGWNLVNGATKHYNSNSIAICWAGNYENMVPTAASFAAGRALLAQGVREGYLTRDFQLLGHRDKARTACPGRNLYARLAALRPG